MPLEALDLRHLAGEEAEKRYHLATPRNLFKQRIPTINGGNAKAKAEEIRNYVHNTFELFEKVFDCLSCKEAFYVPPVHKLRHPMIFYYGHTACFYINKLVVAGLVPRINPKFEEMFAIGVDEMSWDDLNEAHYDWPPVQDVCEYRKKVRDTLDELMTSGKFPLEMPLTLANSTASDANAFWWVMLMGAEHERIHVETASVHVRELPMQYVRSEMADFWVRCPEANARAPTNSLVPIAGGKVRLGRNPDSAVYGWDCDYSDSSNVIDVPPFEASKYIVSNAEFFAFVKADGYHTQRFWDEEGWSWVQWRKPEHPWFWVRDESRPDGYALRLQTELIDLPWDWPCELNNLEAYAFCQFQSEKLGKKVRMLTEEEWTLLFDRYVQWDQFAWEKKAPGNVNLEAYQSSCPVNKYQHGDLYDVIGNVWQHCATPVYPYQGFQVQPFYDDFSVPTFDGRHTCMKGGAWISTGNEATRDARFAFRRHFFQFIGLRYVVGGDVDASKYSRKGAGLDIEVDMITDMSFRESFGGVDNGCVKIAQYAKEVFEKCAKVKPGRAMDFACGAGRVAFELTSMFPDVIGVDYTARRLMPAFAIRERGECQFSVPPRQGADRRMVTVSSSKFSWADTHKNATFFQADPVNLHAHLDNFSLIVCWNCLERSYRPSAVPSHFLSRLDRGGVLIIGGDYNWSNICTTNPTEDVGTPGARSTTTSKSSSRKQSATDNTYLSDPLIASKGADMQEEIFKLLGGESAVERVSDPIAVPVVFPRNDCNAEVRIIHLAAYVKK